MGIGMIILIGIGLIGLVYFLNEFIKTHQVMDILAGVFVTIAFLVLFFFIFYLKRNNHQIGGA